MGFVCVNFGIDHHVEIIPFLQSLESLTRNFKEHDTQGYTTTKNKQTNRKHNKRGETVLMWAAQSQSPEFVKFLLERGADIHKQDENGRTALDHAEGMLNSAVVQLLREAERRYQNDEGED